MYRYICGRDCCLPKSLFSFLHSKRHAKHVIAQLCYMFKLHLLVCGCMTKKKPKVCATSGPKLLKSRLISALLYFLFL